jgi:hypothetical protein
VAKKLSYADAVKLLGGADSDIVAKLDGLTGGCSRWAAAVRSS